jgi:hypothetical protein
MMNELEQAIAEETRLTREFYYRMYGADGIDG